MGDSEFGVRSEPHEIPPRAGFIRVEHQLAYDQAGIEQLPSTVFDGRVWVDEAAWAIKRACFERTIPTERESMLIYCAIMGDDETRLMAETLWRLGGDEGRGTNEALANFVYELLSYVR